MPRHEWTRSARMASGAKLWHCALCGREVQALTQPDAAPCDEGKCEHVPSIGVMAPHGVVLGMRCFCGKVDTTRSEPAERLELERRKVAALERIATLLDGMAMESGELCVTVIGSVEVEKGR